MYDIIGDVHGYAKTLEALLQRLGYQKEYGFYKHSKRKAIFVGDFIDRGPAIRECLQIVKPMVENGFALAVMGNHEYNAICYHTPGKEGKTWLRERNAKNVKQHEVTLKAFENYESEWYDYLNWFKKLPLFLDLTELRIVHAFWDDRIIQEINQQLQRRILNETFIHQASVKKSMQYHWIENLLKGYEILLPDGITYTDKDGFIRSEIRIKWWEDLNNATYRNICVKDGMSLPDKLVPGEIIKQVPIYDVDSPPVFVGHYWNTGTPKLMSHNVCCVDYSIARGGRLVAYRWNGEKSLNPSNFVSQESVD